MQQSSDKAQKLKSHSLPGVPNVQATAASALPSERITNKTAEKLRLHKANILKQNEIHV